MGRPDEDGFLGEWLVAPAFGSVVRSEGLWGGAAIDVVPRRHVELWHALLTTTEPEVVLVVVQHYWMLLSMEGRQACARLLLGRHLRAPGAEGDAG